MPRVGKEAASSSELVQLEVYNSCSEPLSLVWLPGNGEPVEYAQVAPGGGLTQQSAIGHRWQLRQSGGGVAAEMTTTSARVQRLTAEADTRASEAASSSSSGSAGTSTGTVGACASVTAADEETRDPTATDESVSSLSKQVEAFYAQEVDAGVAGIRIRASARVLPAALQAAAHILRRMLRDAPETVLSRLGEIGCAVAVIGKSEKASDVPEHRAAIEDAERLQEVADRTRGLGGTRAMPVTSVGEENLIDIGSDPYYPCESILVHEVSGQTCLG